MRRTTADWRQWPGVAEVRQTGLVLAVQLAEGSDYTDPVGWRIAKAAAARQLLIRPLGNVVYLVPALTISADELDAMLERFGSAIRSAV
jgi:adenosylmethionine-8-amino-7-oxononanoate aminotransferase